MKEEIIKPSFFCPSHLSFLCALTGQMMQKDFFPIDLPCFGYEKSDPSLKYKWQEITQYSLFRVWNLTQEQKFCLGCQKWPMLHV